MRKVEKVCSKPSACRYDAQRRSGGDMLREVACRFWHGEDPLDAAQMTLPPHIRKPVRRVERPGSFRTGRSSIGRVGAFMGRVVRPWGVLGVHRTGWDVHGAHCSFIGRFGRPYGTVSSWRHHALLCSGEAALAAQRRWNVALYPLSPPWQRRSLHFDRHANRRHSAVFPFPLGKSVETGTICTQRSI